MTADPTRTAEQARPARLRRRPLTWAAAAAVLTGAVLVGAAAAAGPSSPDVVREKAAPGVPASSALQSPWKFPREPTLPPVKDATGLPGDRLVRARPVDLPGAGADGTARFDVTSGGIVRTYLLAPARRIAQRAKPALLILLPASNTALRTEYERYDLDALRDHGVTVMVAGPYGGNWNAGRCCGRPVKEGVDDIAALKTMRDDAVRRSGADPGRVAVTGNSSGGLMAWRVACTPSFPVTVAISVAGTLTADCPRLDRPATFVDLHGERDATVPVEGSSTKSSLLGIAPPSVRTSLSTLARAAGCGPASNGGGTTLHRGCRGDASVRLAVYAGRGHGWLDLDATPKVSGYLAGTLTGVR